MNAKLTVDRNNVIGNIDKRIYGSFVEHMGRCVYGGLYEPDHPTADEDGFRTDVMDFVRECQISVVRYPGGNYVSNYRWEDGVGPAELRPKRLDLAWRAVEPNTFGTNEFMKWCKKTGVQPMMAVNLGTRGIEAAADLLEYCNHPSGSALSELRIAHGAKEPHNVRLWCLGNEMDGVWQTGHKTAEEYGRLAYEVGKTMKKYDPTLELVSCGSSAPSMPTFPEWEQITLMHTYDVADYVSLHQYFSNRDNDTPSFLASSVATDRFIQTVIGVCDEVKAKKRGTKDINISFDEWNCWYHNAEADNRIMGHDPWQIAPPLLEDNFNVEDAVVVGNTLMTFLKHADRVKIACQAQLVNVIGSIFTQTGGPAIRQTIFYPIKLTAQYGTGKSLRVDTECEKYDSRLYSDVPYLDAAATWNEDDEEAALFVINRSETEGINLSVRLEDFEEYRPIEHIYIWDEDTKATNTISNPNRISPRRQTLHGSDGDLFNVELKPASWNVIRLKRNTSGK